ncbi:MAG: response regulator transcription factor [Oscillospiraceae bacterium]|jgi:DNA-binding response OmpR family regulator|nr:response regulator transcription factor [Oscillospiraceae bacterium]
MMDSNSQLVLLVEDNRRVQMNNKEILERHGYNIILAMNLAEARAAVRTRMPDVIVLDIALPDGNGLDFLEELRKTSGVPVLVLTADQTPEKSSESLDMGSDDFLRKPYVLKELRARVDALMRRAARVPETVVKGLLKLDVVAGQAFCGGEDLLLTQKEFSLLLLLAQNEGKTVSAEYLYGKIWKTPMGGDKNTVQVTVSKLRKKLEPHGYDIAVIRGRGYVFEGRG